MTGDGQEHDQRQEDGQSAPPGAKGTEGLDVQQAAAQQVEVVMMTTITLFHGLAGWTAALMVAFALGTMMRNLEAEITIWLERRHV